MESRLEATIQTLRAHMPALHAKYGVTELGIFGSVARGDHGPESDVDLLVGFDRPIGLAFVSLAYDLEKLLGSKVDLVDNRRLPDRFSSMIMPDIIYV